MLAIDGGSPSLTGTATVTIYVGDENDNPPVASPHDVTIPEDIQPGMMLFTLTSTDPDTKVNAYPQYRISNASNPGDAFAVGQLSGAVRVKNSLDRETTPLYHLVIEVSKVGQPQVLSMEKIILCHNFL